MSLPPVPEDSHKSLLACVEVGKILTSTVQLDKILELIVEKISELIHAENWSLLLKDQKTRELIFEVVVGQNKEKLKGVKLARNEGIAGYVAETGKSVFLADVHHDPRFSPKIDQVTGFKTESIVCFPLKSHERILGVIEIVNLKNITSFQYRDYPGLSLLADFAAIAIENSNYFARIQRMSITDEYTGLYNARYLHQVLEQTVREYRSNRKQFAVVFMDIDNFKQVVDHYGHMLGSQVLKEVGEIISSCLPPGDLLFKYGGDEYVLLLRDKTKTQAAAVVENILQQLRSSSYLRSEEHPVRVTASFGIAVFPDDAKNKKELLLLADNLMFGIKNSTKNGIGVR